MKVIENENVSPYDVDGTLIIHQAEDTIPLGEKVLIQDPAIPGAHIAVRINRPMVRLLKESKARGEYVVVWSRGGWQWAKNVLEALNATAYVDQVMSKPLATFDDTPIEHWCPYRVFLGPDEAYKVPAKQQRQTD